MVTMDGLVTSTRAMVRRLAVAGAVTLATGIGAGAAPVRLTGGVVFEGAGVALGKYWWVVGIVVLAKLGHLTNPASAWSATTAGPGREWA